MGTMPVMVVAADTAAGDAILRRVHEPGREVRAFVSDPEAAIDLRARGIKVALGDVSDSSHVAAACLHCHSVVFVVAGAEDGRELSFADGVPAVLDGWAEAAREAAARRVIWVGTDVAPPSVAEAAVVPDDADLARLADRVAALDEAASL